MRVGSIRTGYIIWGVQCKMKMGGVSSSHRIKILRLQQQSINQEEAPCDNTGWMRVEPALGSMQRGEISLTLWICSALYPLGVKAEPGAHDFLRFFMDVGHAASCLQLSSQRRSIVLGGAVIMPFPPSSLSSSESKALVRICEQLKRGGGWGALHSAHQGPVMFCWRSRQRENWHVEKTENFVFWKARYIHQDSFTYRC